MLKKRFSMYASVATVALMTAACQSTPAEFSLGTANPMAQPLSIEMVGEFRTGVFDDGAAEIPAFDPTTNRVFIVNGADQTIDILDIEDPSKPVKVTALKLDKYGKTANSVAVKNGIAVAAVENDDKQANGMAVFMDTNGNVISALEVGALPDMVKITPDGKYALIANEGEPNDAFDNDPEGTVSVIDMAMALKGDPAAVRTVDFQVLNGMELPHGMRTANPGSSSNAQDVEPEYIAVSGDGSTAFVAMQENNALAIIDVPSATLTRVVGLGYKDHRVNALDASNRDGGINIRTWPVWGMYQPDSIDAIDINGATYVITANEGDARDYDGYSEETRIKDLTLDPATFPTARSLQNDSNLGRLKTTTAQGDTDGDGDHDFILAYGARSFSVLDASGNMVFDSGDQFEQLVASIQPNTFNSTNDENFSMDDRSDDKGPEPEGLATGYVNGTPYAFIGLERHGGFVVYDLTNPKNPQYVTFRNDRNFAGDPKTDSAGEMAPEGFAFVSATDSPTGNALLVVASEVSGSTAIYEMK